MSSFAPGAMLRQRFEIKRESLEKYSLCEYFDSRRQVHCDHGNEPSWGPFYPPGLRIKNDSIIQFLLQTM